MSIAVADIITRIRKITRRDNETELSDDDIETLILESCREISKRLLNLKSSSSGTLSGDGTTITAPTDMVPCDAAMDELYLDSVLQDRITFAEWRAGKIAGYCYYNGTIYINPSISNDRSYTLYYSTIHGTLSTNLEFDDDLKMAVIWLTCKKVYDNYFAAESNFASAKAEGEYEKEIQKNKPAKVVATKIRTTRY